MIPRQLRRLFDQRGEPRVDASSSTAVLAFRGRNHVVRVCNLSESGAMISFPEIPNIGETISLQLMERGTVKAEVKWVRDGRIGLFLGFRRIEIGAQAEKGFAKCWVRDHGIGIEPRYVGRIFGLFEQIDADAQGTGVGLALVRRIA